MAMHLPLTSPEILIEHFDPRNKGRYLINEIFYSLQGEGVRAGTANVFIRFSGCNLRCEKGVVSDRSPGGFTCDTEFDSGEWMTLEEIRQAVASLTMGKDGTIRCWYLILTGGEPALQLDANFCTFFRRLGYRLAVETNGTIELPLNKWGGKMQMKFLSDYMFDWICVSPKTPKIQQVLCHEIKFVLAAGEIPPVIHALETENYLVSPAFEGDKLPEANLRWCIEWCLTHPMYRLSTQQHKQWGVR